jgi:hypothetical protein
MYFATNPPEAYGRAASLEKIAPVGAGLVSQGFLLLANNGLRLFL